MKWAPWTAVLLVLLAVGGIRIRLLNIPLERDEGEYAYAGQLLLQGIPPYQLAANMKLPGAYAAYALVMAAFGQSIAAIHLGLLLVNAAAIVLVYLLGRRLFSVSAGLAACASYALLSVGSSVDGTQAHATHFIVLPALAATLLLLRYTASRRSSSLWWSGFLFGLAFVMKQQAIFFGVFGAAVCAVHFWRGTSLPPSRRGALRALALFLSAAALPFAVTCLILWRAGVFPRFWFWTFTYARQYALESSLSDGLAAFNATFPSILQQNLALWALAAAGLVLLWWKRDNRKSAAFASAFLFFSFLTVCPGLLFREHYFVQLLPAVALLAGAAVGSPGTNSRSRLPYWWLFAGLLVFSVVQQREFLFRMSPLQACRVLYGGAPFPEAIQVAAYIRAHSAAGARVAVLGSEPEIYFYSARHSATSYIYTYGLMEAQPYALTMQNDMIREIEASAPEFVVRVGADDSWLRQPESPSRIFDWWAAYGPPRYRLVGLADIVSEARTEYRWDAAAEAYQPQSDNYLAVYRRTMPARGAAPKSAFIRTHNEDGPPTSGRPVEHPELDR